VDEKGGKERDKKWVEDRRTKKCKFLILIDEQGGEK